MEMAPEVRMMDTGTASRRFMRCAALAVVIATATGCASAPFDPSRGLRIEADGWVERGAVVRISLFRDDVEITQPEWTLTVDPADAADVDEATRSIRPLRTGPIRVVVSTGEGETELALQVASPPKIVFQKLVEGNRDIYSVALDGEELQRLTTDPAEDAEPTSDDAWIVFTSFREGVGSLYRMPAAGGAVERLTSSSSRDSQSDLSSAGNRLAFIRTTAGNPRLWTAAADGSEPSAVTTPPPGTIEASPAWAPAGDRLAYASTAGGNSDIWLVTPGAAPTMLIGSDEADVEPTWSPDGESIVFASTRDGDTELYRFDLDSEEVTRLTNRPGSDGRPTYLPDGRIVYSAREGNQVGLYWMDPRAPGVNYPIPTGSGEAGSPAALR